MDYRNYNDSELLSYVNESEEANEIIYKKYEPLINSLARKMYKYCTNSGLELNDLIQEGMLGLSNAITHFSEQKDTTFYTFAKTCIERKIISTIVSTKRLKNKILNESLSLDSHDEDNSVGLEVFISDNENNPERLIVDNENESELIKTIKLSLTDFENQVFDLKINNFNYKEIAEILDKKPKAIDNALQRIKIKVKEQLKK